VVLNLTAGSTLKEPPLRFWIGLAEELVRRGHPTLILSAPVRRDAEMLASEVPGTRLISAPSLYDIARLLAAADVVVSPDTGILHMTAALRRPFVGLFGPTDPLFLGPYDASCGTILQSPAQHVPICRHCWTAQLLPAARCAAYRDRTCMWTFPPLAVALEVERLLQTDSQENSTVCRRGD
jgi:ADP-heptose:LPS heptosyltransferase